MSTTGFAPASGAELAWTLEGEGIPVLLIHAGVADQRMWEPASARLQDRHMVVRYDMRGFGLSRNQPGAFSPAADAVAVLDALPLPSAHVAGCSYGGHVALELALSQPERVTSVTLFSPPHPDLDWADDVEAFGAAEEAALATGDLDEAVDLNLVMWVDRSAGERRDGALRDLVGRMQRRAFELQAAAPIELEDGPLATRGALASISCPAQVVIGALDHPDFTRSAHRLAAEVPRARLRQVPNAGHLLPLEQPDVAAAALAETIADALRSRPEDAPNARAKQRR